MAKPEKRWQLLLVADDGQIIPFKRIKGFVLTMMTLLVLLGLVCAGLGWQLIAEKVRHRNTRDQLADANRQAANYKSEHELIAAELVLVQARIEKKGVLIPRRPDRMAKQKPAPIIDAEPVPDNPVDAGKNESKPATTVSPPAAKPLFVPPVAAPVAKAPQEVAPETTPAKVPAPPMVALGELRMKHDAGKKILTASFRVSNAGPRSSPVAGRCVLVLKNEGMDPKAWLAMPNVPLVNGKPTGKHGWTFRISRLIDLRIKAVGQTDPSSFKTATIYVFDASGAEILEKDYSIDIPTPKLRP